MTPAAKARLQLLAAILSAAVALLSALATGERVRLVDVLLLFGGGFGAGAGLTAALRSRGRPGVEP